MLNNKFAGSAHSWSQTYVAQGRGLASARLSAAPGKTADGGWVQRVAGLERVENYRVAGRVRSRERWDRRLALSAAYHVVVVPLALYVWFRR